MNKIVTNQFNRHKLINNKHTQTVTNKSFSEVLDNINKNNELKFSRHAKKRIDDREIVLNNNEITKINNALYKASNKGVKEALILMEDKAFIASVKNKTIITITTLDKLKENVFTNIDGAVII